MMSLIYQNVISFPAVVQAVKRQERVEMKAGMRIESDLRAAIEKLQSTPDLTPTARLKLHVLSSNLAHVRASMLVREEADSEEKKVEALHPGASTIVS